MSKISKKRLAKQFFSINGEEKAIIKTVEELSELAQELCKHLYNPINQDVKWRILYELADVEFMLEQLKMVFEESEVKAAMNIVLENNKGKLTKNKLNHNG